MSLSHKELNLVRQWFNVVADTLPGYLDKCDVVLIADAMARFDVKAAMLSDAKPPRDEYISSLRREIAALSNENKELRIALRTIAGNDINLELNAGIARSAIKGK